MASGQQSAFRRIPTLSPFVTAIMSLRMLKHLSQLSLNAREKDNAYFLLLVVSSLPLRTIDSICWRRTGAVATGQ